MQRNHIFLLAVFAAVVMFGGLNFRELASGDETRVAGIIAEMALSGDLVTPKLNGADFLEYPPLYYQLGSVCMRLFGFTDAAAKLPSALCAFGAALLVFALARRAKLSAAAALTAGIMLLTGAQFFNNGRKCMVDMMLAFFVLLAIYAFHSLLAAADRRRQVWCFLLYAAGLAGGFMTKGLVGWAFPWFGLGTWLIADDLLFAKRFNFKRYLLLGLGVIPALVPILCWLYRLYLAGGREALATVLIENGIGRFTGAQGDHVEAVWYYLVKLPALFQPWLLVFVAALVHALRMLRKKQLPREMLPLLCEAVAPFVLLSCAASKRQVYLLPIYSAWAVLAAWFLIDRREAWLPVLERRISPLRKYLPRVAAAATGVALAVFIVLAPGWGKAIPAAALGLLAAAVFVRPGLVPAAVLAGALFVLCFDVGGLALRNRKKSLRPLFDECRRCEEAGYFIRIGVPTSERTQGAAVFYLRKRIPEVDIKTPIAPREKRIVRSGKKLFNGRAERAKFADHHYLLGADNAPHLLKRSARTPKTDRRRPHPSAIRPN